MDPNTAEETPLQGDMDIENTSTLSSNSSTNTELPPTAVTWVMGLADYHHRLSVVNITSTDSLLLPLTLLTYSNLKDQLRVHRHIESKVYPLVWLDTSYNEGK